MLNELIEPATGDLFTRLAGEVAAEYRREPQRAAGARGAAESMERGGPARPFAREPR